MYKTRGQDDTEISNCVREKLLSYMREKVKLCERKNLGCVRKKFKFCEKKILSCVRKNLGCSFAI